MKVRRILASICCALALCIYAASGYICWMTWAGEVSYKLGFLMFLPVWISGYWFSTFFAQLGEKRVDGRTKVVIHPGAYKIVNTLCTVFSAGTLIFWGYIYWFLYRLSEQAG